MAVAIELELQYTPWATTTPELRATVDAAFRTADLAVTRVTKGYGTDGPPPLGGRWAPPSLAVQLFVTATGSEEETPEQQVFACVQHRLKAAVGTLRRVRPELPVSLAVFAPTRRTLYAFRHDDAADDLAAGIDALVTDCDHDHARVHGWDRAAGCWIPL